jgi:TRAP-type C4-dicarboxylate transport system substrate-binding protein
MKRILSLGAFAAMLAVAGAASAADPVTLKFAWPAPPNTDSHRIAMAWKDRVLASAAGTIDIKVFPGDSIAKTTNVLDRVTNAVAEIGFGIFGPYSRQYPQSFVAQLPFMCNNSTECSTALWRAYQQGLIAGEHQAYRPLALFCFTGTSLHSTKAIRKLEDMAGLKIAASGKIIADDVALMGGSPVTITPAEFYESLNRGLLQGVLISWPGAEAYKLHEVSRYHMDVPFGLFPAFVVMNHAAYARLPDAAKRAFDGHSGEAFSRAYGAGLDKSNLEAIDRFKKMSNHEVVALAPAELKRWEQRLDPVIAEWVKATPNGAKVLAGFRAEVAKVRSGS